MENWRKREEKREERAENSSWFRDEGGKDRRREGCGNEGEEKK